MENHIKKTLVKGVLPALPFTFCAITAVAQDSQPTARLEEVVVTARKREETLQEVPVSVNVVSGELIQSLRIEGLDSLGSQVPGLVVGESTGAAGGAVALRGISSGEGNFLTEQAVSIIVDGVPVNDARLVQSSMFDVQQIEVMRGPQALFFGKNSPGGAIAIHTKDPTDEFELMLSGAYETEAEEQIGRFVISGPITDTLKGRLAASYSEQEGLFDVVSVNEVTSVNGFPMGFPVRSRTSQDRDDIFAIGTLLFEPNENFTARLKVSHMEREVDGGIFRISQRIHCPTGSPQALIPGGDCRENDTTVTSGLNPAGLAIIDQNIGLKTSKIRDGVSNTKISTGALDLNYTIPDSGLALTSVTGYYKVDNYFLIDATFSPASQLVSQNHPRGYKITQEFRLSSDWDAPLNFTTGFFYEDSKINSDSATAIIFPGLVIDLGVDDLTQEGETWSVFFEGQFDITDTLTLSGGARYTEDTKKLDRIFDGVPVLQEKDNKSWTNLSPEVTLNYRPMSNVMLFASYREGFKSGGFDGSAQVALLRAGGVQDFRFDEETIKGFEGGIKSTWLDDTLQLNVTAFSYKYEDMQLSVRDAETNATTVLNAAESTTEGVELESIWATPVAGLTLRGSLNYLNAEYDDFLMDCYAGQTPTQGCNLEFVGGRFNKQDLSGEKLVFASKWSGAVGFEYERPLTAGWNLGITGYTTYQSSQNTSTDNIPNSEQGSYWLSNASLQLFSNDETWEVFVNGTNLGNKFWHTRASTTPLTGSGTGTPNGMPGDVLGTVNGGRNVTIGVTYRY